MMTVPEVVRRRWPVSAGLAVLVVALVAGVAGCYGPTGTTTKTVTFSCQSSAIAPYPKPILRTVEIRAVAPAWSVRDQELPIELQVTGLVSTYDTGVPWYVTADIELKGLGPITQDGSSSNRYWTSSHLDAITSTTPVEFGVATTEVTAPVKGKGTLAIKSLRPGSVLEGHGVGEACTPVGGAPVIISVDSR